MNSDAFILKLDPTGSMLVYSTYLGGSREDAGRGIAVDADGNAYVAGYTSSLDFPVQNALQKTRGGARDGFIAKVSTDGTTLVYSTYLGGEATDIANAIAVDGSGSVYVTGITYGPFPTKNPIQKSLSGGKDAFVSKLSPDGSALVYSTYLGGEGDDFGTAIAVDANGSAYVTGVTGSSSFPTQAAIQPKFGAANLLGADAFVSKLSVDGSKLVYSTFLGGKGTDVGTAIAVAPDGSVYVAGETNSVDFPSASAIQPALAGVDNGFIVKLDPAGSTLNYSTFLGGSGFDQIAAIALDPTGLYIAGTSLSTDFPATPGAYQAGNQGQADALVAKIVETSQ
jgi:Tol biopolymer transport system component